ncbi:MAG: hypothetical protein K8R54_12110 [Bacteroidales bacterium]|nr:hypothetical protein [Bacteroidales bacterium]
MKLKNLTIIVACLLMSYGVATAQNNGSTNQDTNTTKEWPYVSNKQIYEGVVVGVDKETFQVRYTTTIYGKDDEITSQDYEIIRIKSDATGEIDKILVVGKTTYAVGDDFKESCKVEFDKIITLDEIAKKYTTYVCSSSHVSANGHNSKLNIDAVLENK